MESDSELLRKYSLERDETAFTELVQRHVNLVYSVACRESNGDPVSAQDITQLVFIELARKARRLIGHPALAGWLYSSARLIGANLRRSQRRRAIREQSVESMNEPIVAASPDPPDELLRGLLDQVLHKLTDRDRGAVVLRFLEGYSLREVGATLGVSEDAARMRVDRALGKLRRLLESHGVTSTASGLSAALGGALLPINSQITAKATVIAGVAVKGAAATATSSALLNLLLGALKLKTAIGLTGLALVVGTAVVLNEKVHSSGRQRTDNNPDEWIWTTDALSNVPPMVIIRPTRFDKGVGISRGTRLRWHADSLPHLIAFAHNVEEQQLVVAASLPAGKYDWLVTRGEPLAELRREIKKQFNVVGERAKATREVLLLEPGTNEPPDLTRVQGFTIGTGRKYAGRLEVRARNMKYLASILADMFGKPVFDRTGLNGRYDMMLQWDPEQDRLASMNSALDSYGLQLVPSHERIDVVKVVSVVADDLEQRFLSVDCFALGRVGPLGSISEGEQLLRQIARRSDGLDILRRALTNGTPESGCYSLYGMRRLAFRQFDRAAASVPWLTENVTTMEGCLLSSETGSSVIHSIADGLYDDP